MFSLFTTDFTTVFWVFLLLIALVHVTNFLYRDLAQPAFIKAFLGAGTSSLKARGPPTEVRNTDSRPIDLFESHSVQQKVVCVISTKPQKFLKNSGL